MHYKDYKIPKFIAGARIWPTAKTGNRKHFGCGISPILDEARIKAMAEGYERYVSGLFRIDSYQAAVDFSGENWLDPNRFIPLHNSYRKKQGLQLFDPVKKWEWVKGTRYLSDEEIMIPIDLVFYPLCASEIGRKLCYQCNSSGVATHFSKEKAIKRALFELIERDAFSVTWYSKRTVTALPFSHISKVDIPRINYWLNEGWNVKFLNLTLDSVPVVMAIIYSENRFPYFVAGASADDTFVKAAMKALDEAEGRLLLWIKQKRLRKHIAPEEVRTISNHEELYFNKERLEELRWLLDAEISKPKAIKKRNSPELLGQFDPIIVDITPDYIDCDLKVIRVLSEKLLPLNFGYGSEHIGHQRLDDLGLKWYRKYPALPHFFA